MKFYFILQGTVIQADTLADASAKYAAMRDRCRYGASTFPTPTLHNADGSVAGYFSYNGRIWTTPSKDHSYARGAATPVMVYDNRTVQIDFSVKV